MKLILKIVGGFLVILVLVLTGFVIHGNWAIAHNEIRAYDEGAPGRYITFGEHRWHVAVAGDLANDPTGAPLLLIHGFLAPGHMNFDPWKDKLAAHRTLVMPDLLSYGHSERVTVPGDYYTLSHTARALAAVLDELGVAQVDVVGHSYGGMVAAQFAADYPQRVRRIVFMSTTLSGFARANQEDIIDLPLGIGRAMAWHIIGGGRAGVIGMACAGDPHCSWAPYARIKDNTDSMRAAMYTTRHTPDFDALPSKISTISAPALVLVGNNDFLISQADGERDAKVLPNARFQSISGGAHMPYFQKPEETLKAVIEFLQPKI